MSVNIIVKREITILLLILYSKIMPARPTAGTALPAVETGLPTVETGLPAVETGLPAVEFGYEPPHKKGYGERPSQSLSVAIEPLGSKVAIESSHCTH